MKKRKWLSILLMLGTWILLSMPIFAAEENINEEASEEQEVIITKK